MHVCTYCNIDIYTILKKLYVSNNNTLRNDHDVGIYDKTSWIDKIGNIRIIVDKRLTIFTIDDL